jgi:putative ABC transport system permease protein
MLDFDRWAEVGESLSRHKLRTGLTAFGVFWGVFMLVVLLGMGKGLEHGMMRMFQSQAVNIVWLEGLKATKPYQGLAPGRPIELTADDAEGLGKLPGVEAAVPWKEFLQKATVRHGLRSASAIDITGVTPAGEQQDAIILLKGRFLNPLDLRERRKVAVLNRRVVEALFLPRQEAVGERILIEGISFLIVGVVTRIASEAEARRLYIPYSTLRATLNPSPVVSWIGLTTHFGDGWESVKAPAMRYLAAKHRFDPSDTPAVYAHDGSVRYRQIRTLLAGIRWFLIVVGVGTLLAGCVGVSNTMLVTVKERTREIGVRKAIGASPATILLMILQEAFVVTLLAGYLGLVAGVGLIELLREMGAETQFFRDPEVDLPIALGALAVLVSAGLVAGYLPARQALKIRPIEALRHE